MSKSLSKSEVAGLKRKIEAIEKSDTVRFLNWYPENTQPELNTHHVHTNQTIGVNSEHELSVLAAEFKQKCIDFYRKKLEEDEAQAARPIAAAVIKMPFVFMPIRISRRPPDLSELVHERLILVDEDFDIIKDIHVGFSTEWEAVKGDAVYWLQKMETPIADLRLQDYIFTPAEPYGFRKPVLSITEDEVTPIVKMLFTKEPIGEVKRVETVPGLFVFPTQLSVTGWGFVEMFESGSFDAGKIDMNNINGRDSFTLATESVLKAFVYLFDIGYDIPFASTFIKAATLDAEELRCFLIDFNEELRKGAQTTSSWGGTYHVLWGKDGRTIGEVIDGFIKRLSRLGE